MRRQATPVRSSVSWRPAGAMVGAAALVGLFALSIFELSNWDKISPGVSALGTPVGGLSQQEAITRLTPGVQQLLDRPLDIQAPNNQSWRTTARDLGLRLD